MMKFDSYEHRINRASTVTLAALLAAALLFVACKGAPPPQSALPEVAVAPVVQRDVPVIHEWVGALDGFVNAQIRPQVTGYVVRRTYQEGSFVKKGQLELSRI